MRIGDFTPSFNIQNPIRDIAPERYLIPAQEGQNRSGAGIVVDISQEGWDAYARSKIQGGGEIQKSNKTEFPTECKTCASRKYVDVSDDSSVSFQSPTHIPPGQAAASVASHESEHVTNEQARAEQEGREIVSQTVTLKTSICPECGRVYVSGGETRTVSRQKSEDGGIGLDQGPQNFPSST